MPKTYQFTEEQVVELTTAKKDFRPSVPCHHIREYRYAYGAVEPLTGESFFLILPYNNTVCTNLFLAELSQAYPNDTILLIWDGASWHRSNGLVIPKNIRLLSIPPATPEMNPIEQIWTWIRRHGFRNEIFQTLDKVMDRLCIIIQSHSNNTVKSITARDWIINCF